MKASPEHQSQLIELQLIDTALMGARHRLASLPEREQITAIHARLATSAAELAIVEAELADAAIDLRRSELEVEQVSDRITKDEVRLASGSASAKELEQLQHEVGTLGKRKSELEDLELEIMMRHDSVKTRVEELRNDEVGLQKLELELNIRLENGITEIEKEIAEKELERRSLVPQIDPALVELYEKIRASGAGVGAALLLGNTCGGCHLAINAIEIERIKTLDGEEVLRCEECRRILVRI
ncbi:MAG: C4-type zinc ribbon domain-containing protein [Actinomycetes bacterium]